MRSGPSLWPVTEAMDRLVARLRGAGCVFAEDEAELLWAATDAAAERELLVRRRIGGEPLEQVLGWAEFDGLRLTVAPGVFVPRRRTRLLARRAAGLLPAVGAVTALDLCCGVGAVAAVLARARPGVRLVAADLDPVATDCARRNLPPDARVVTGDLFSAVPLGLRGDLDVIAANAPYVPTEAIATMPAEARLHERTAALDGGDDGLDLHRRITEEARGWLRPGGALLIETSVAQADATAALMSRGGLDPRVEHDDDLDATVVIGVRA